MFADTWRQWLNRQFKALQQGNGRRRVRRDAQLRRYRPRLEYLEDRCLPAILTVTGTGDTIAVDGLVTLREAITSANNNADVNADVAGVGAYGTDTIQFNIPGAGVHTITPASQLPTISDPLTIDGYTQPGASPNSNGPTQADNAVLQIELDGSVVTNNANGLVLGDLADLSTIRGLVIDQGFGAGILVDASDVHIEGCFIGIDPTGTTAHGNTAGINFEFGVGTFDTSNGHVGGTSPAARNLISGNTGPGILIGSSAGHVVEGNLIGTDATGLVGITNGSGVVIQSNNNLIGGSTLAARNVINGANEGVNVDSQNSPTGNQIQGNFIQVLIDGVTPGAATATGIFLGGFSFQGTSSGTQIGGLTSTPGTGPGNVIRGAFGINIGNNSDNNVIQGNLIGTDATGMQALGIGQVGIQVTGASNTIGGPSPDARNVISACANVGVQIGVGNSGVQNNLIQGNFIGTDITGTPNSMGNGEGVATTGTTDNQILDNIIAGNSDRGVFVSSSTTNTAILGNSIFANGALGIDLFGGTQDAFSVTQNDPGDADTGPNNLQNFPDLTSAALSPTSTTVSGTLDSAAGTTFTLDFFANAQGDPSTFGEGQTFLGSGTVITGSGQTSFTITGLAAAPSGQTIITATATDPSGNTSEFSQTLAGTVVAGAATHFVVTARPTTPPGAPFSITVAALDQFDNTATSYTGTVHFTSSDKNNPSLPADFTFTAADAGKRRFTNVTLNTTGTQTITATDTSDSTITGSAEVLVAPSGVATTFVVTNTLDSGPGSLRQAIRDANAHAGNDTIDFSIGTGAHTIRVGDGGFGALPTITEAVIIDGTSQPGFLAKPLVGLDGTTVGVGIFSGLDIAAGSSTVKALAINGFSGSGIRLLGGGNRIVGNFLGTDLTGTLSKGNGVAGVEIVAGSFDTIGGTTPGSRNVISGNVGGVLLDAAASNTFVKGNFIGTDFKGTHALANNTGVEVHSTSATIGGTTLAARNLISGNNGEGVLLLSAASVLGNFIGTDVVGTHALGNGVGIDVRAAGVTIGGTQDGARNIISGNLMVGVGINGDSAIVQGNFIGTDVLGTHAVGNGGSGIVVTGGSNNLIGGENKVIGGKVQLARNVISGNLSDGIRFFSGPGFAPTGNLVQGNYIGPDVTGRRTLGNQQSGVAILGGFQYTLGGTTPGTRNIISGNLASGVFIRGGGAQENVVEGNYIGVDLTGNTKLANSIGVEIDGADGNTIGGTVAGARNIISGNTSDGVFIDHGGELNLVEGNYIGVNRDGTVALPNQVGVHIDSGSNTVGGTTAAAANIISGNSIGVLIDTSGTSNVIQGNLIGTNPAGTAAVPNGDGIDVVGFLFAGLNTIGGTVAGAGNVISGNNHSGIFVTGGGLNFVRGNLIGTDSTGKAAIGNADGIVIVFSSDNTIGGDDAADGSTDGVVNARNVISGNKGDGVRLKNQAIGNQVLGNFIGTDVTGTVTLANGTGAGGGNGVEISGTATDNIIGGSTPGAANFISGNFTNGVLISANNNQVLGNLIGTDVSGTKRLANGAVVNGTPVGNGVEILAGTGNMIGGVNEVQPDGSVKRTAGNVISGNTNDGVLISGGSGNQVLGNLIGTDISGALPLANGSSTSSGFIGNGLEINGGAQSNQIGGPNAGERNIISGNITSDIRITGIGTALNVVQGNFIGTDATGTAALPGTSSSPKGVVIESSAHDNIIGGVMLGEGNLISGIANGSAGSGILIQTDAAGNLVQGNLIGTDFSRAHQLPNAIGVSISLASNNTIGGTSIGAGNVISGNSGNGVEIRGGLFGGTPATGNVVQGNFIGTDVSGTQAVANNLAGIFLTGSSAFANTIGGTVPGATNVISGNAGAGIQIDGTSNNQVQGNFIGTDLSGTFAVPNGGGGVVLNKASTIVVGGSVPGAANVISGNALDGVLISSFASGRFGRPLPGNQVLGNLIGTDVTGNFALPNAGNGVQLAARAIGNTIGGDSSDAANTISGNANDGILINGTGTQSNQVLGNFIGTDPSGTFAVENSLHGVEIAGGASANTVGGAAGGSGNVISGNRNIGVFVHDTGTANNQIVGNLIGTDFTGTFDIANGFHGVDLASGAKNNIVGGTTTGAGNVISGNALVGVNIFGSQTTGNQILGNFIGTDASGTFALSNGVGVNIQAPTNTIGGAAAGAGNVISGNASDGVSISGNGTTGNQLLGNLIGTDVFGTSALANGGVGVAISAQANANNIGTTRTGNLISGNAGAGLLIAADGTFVQGNFIGTDITGSVALPNGGPGVSLSLAHGTRIGGGFGGRNVISGNAGDGLTVSGSNKTNVALNTFVIGNFIGTDVSGVVALGNAGNGVLINGKASSNLIQANIVAFNGLAGVRVDSGNGNQIIGQNSIFSNAGLGIDLNAANNANRSQSAPLLTSAVLSAAGTAITIRGTLTSTANATFTLEFFASPAGDPEGKGFFGTKTVTTNAQGRVTFTAQFTIAVPVGDLITATATDPLGDTSEFSNAVVVR